MYTGMRIVCLKIQFPPSWHCDVYLSRTLGEQLSNRRSRPEKLSSVKRRFDRRTWGWGIPWLWLLHTVSTKRSHCGTVGGWTPSELRLALRRRLWSNTRLNHTSLWNYHGPKKICGLIFRDWNDIGSRNYCRNAANISGAADDSHSQAVIIG
jgi:hypothetical protein